MKHTVIKSYRQTSGCKISRIYKCTMNHTDICMTARVVSRWYATTHQRTNGCMCQRTYNRIDRWLYGEPENRTAGQITVQQNKQLTG
ncbi:MAG: hypothetical protein LBP83_03685 [Dysgonamonadaceae bacterium]|jgi:hypothetical protein|nr:hypothetical protein [Dysgonamonadaceae bacterium]